jgi:hypothetical protein
VGSFENATTLRRPSRRALPDDLAWAIDGVVVPALCVWADAWRALARPAGRRLELDRYAAPGCGVGGRGAREGRRRAVPSTDGGSGITAAERAALEQFIGWEPDLKKINAADCALRQPGITDACKDLPRRATRGRRPLTRRQRTASASMCPMVCVLAASCVNRLLANPIFGLPRRFTRPHPRDRAWGNLVVSSRAPGIGERHPHRIPESGECQISWVWRPL